MDYTIREMTIDDYDAVRALWEQTEGMSLEEGDDRHAIGIYLRRNPGFCFLAYVHGELAGTVLCGHEGRRGILRHLAVKRQFRGKGIARALINRCLAALAKDGITKCNIFVLDSNSQGRSFWEHMGWRLLEDNYRTMQSATATRESP